MDKVLTIGYRESDRAAILTCPPELAHDEWFSALTRTLADKIPAMDSPFPGTLVLPWWNFLAVKSEVLQLRQAYGITVELSEVAKTFLRNSLARRMGYSDAAKGVALSVAQIEASLRKSGFLRKLTPEQTRNVGKLAGMPAAATFSVPGAGKTTEGLAVFAIHANPDEGLLVIAPKNAFGAWDEQLEECFGESVGQFVRLRGGSERIEEQLKERPRLAIITYQQMVRVPNLIAEFLTSRRTFVFLDESHRIKSGKGKPIAAAILSISHLPIRKLIMSGTPMPQSREDLIPQFGFLYPEIKTTSESIVQMVRPIYVRTTKKELRIPDPVRLLVPVAMMPGQRRLYDLIKSEVARQAEQTLNTRSRQALRLMGRSVMRLLQIVSNPALLASELSFLQQDALGDALAEGDSPKLEYACRRVRQLAGQGKKVLIWTSFRRNVEILAERLGDMKAVFIHGGVDAGNDDDMDSREGKIWTFHHDKNCLAMVANPAAASEGISLHTVCQNAIYIDRTYNAGHYLQSEDRIHRLGITVAPTIEIIECENSIDQSVRARLSAKVSQMAAVLEDPGLNVDPIRIDSLDVDDDVDGDLSEIDFDDVKSILECLNAPGGI